MSATDFTTSITVDKPAITVFNAIIDPRGWWGKTIEGKTDELGAEWSYRFKDLHYSLHKTVKLIPGRKVVWHVVDGQLSFVDDKQEWTGTDIVFDITERNNRTVLQFTHRGLVPTGECYDICSDAWSGLIKGSLRNLIETGVGLPDSV